MGKLAGCTLFITGASRGIGKAIALRAAQDGANVVIAAKTAVPHPKLPGTIYTAAEEVEAAGGKCLPCVVDIRNDEEVESAVNKAVETFGGIDILVNNASAIHLTGTEATPMKRYDLMMDINLRGTFLTSKLCLPHLRKSKNPHILNITPPLIMKQWWFADHVAYSMAKYGSSLFVLGMAEELKSAGIAVNALWPHKAIATAAVVMLRGEDAMRKCRKASIMGDAAHVILTRNSREVTGKFLLDDVVLKEHGVTDFDQYANIPGAGSDLFPDFFLEPVEDIDRLQISTASVSTVAVFDTVRQSLNSETVAKIGASYHFAVDGSHWLLDLKEGSGSIEPCDTETEADVTMSVNAEDLVLLFCGKLDFTTAFMCGRLKISGNLSHASSLEKLIKQISFASKL